MSRQRALREYYQGVALILLNCCVLFLVINVALFIVFKVRDTYFPDFYRITEWGTEHLDKIYPDLSKEEINALLRETWARPYVYEPFTQFKERPYRGKYLNVEESGFRMTKNQGPWPPERKYFTVFLFGGSTTFNYGVPDHQTIASYLQEFLSTVGLDREPRVYNFGRAHYYSTQERLLFEKLLTSGAIPDMAVFIDGLNDFYYYKDELAFAYELQELFDMQNGTMLYLLRHLPITRAAVGMKARLSQFLTNVEESNGRSERDYKSEPVSTGVIERYIRNKTMIDAIGAVFNVKTVFVWQPIPTYKYDLRYHPFSHWGFEGHTYSQYGYLRMARLADQMSLGKNFIWCADIQQDVKEPLYVDRVHYTSKMSRMVAQCIVDVVAKRKILPLRRG